MKRLHKYHIQDDTHWDFIIIGGGATGLGTALDAASRGYKTLLIEQSDFAKGTSSRSTKLVHGGVRYLAQGDIGLVRHALEERGLMELNAPHLVHKKAFIIPCYHWFLLLKYFIGLSIYDALAGKYSFGKSKFLSKNETLELMPGIKSKRLKGSIEYYDGQFDDARLAINIAQTAIEYGATLINYLKVTNLIKEDQKVIGVQTIDAITGETFNFKGKVVVNATGVFVDDILKMNNPSAKKLVRPSQGVHVVLNKDFLNSNSALMIPKTSDGRVLFAVPWHEHLLVGTTDTPLEDHNLEPRALAQEIDFILNNAKVYFNRPPKYTDILSVFSGLRPLAASNKSNGSTKEISRDHKLIASAPGLITITGGKWTTYRRMAEETVNLAIKNVGLNFNPCTTKTLKIHGATACPADDNHLNYYGSDRKNIEKIFQSNPEFKSILHPKFPYTLAEIHWIIEHEMVETIEDILSRRLRVLFIDAQAAIEMAPQIATILAQALQADKDWEEKELARFINLAKGYLYSVPNNK